MRIAHLPTTAFLWALMLTPNLCHASGIKVENVTVINRMDVLNTPLAVQFDISWENAWHNDKNHDAAWVFMKYGGQWNNQVHFTEDGHKIILNRSRVAKPTIKLSPEKNGFFLYAGKSFRGDVNLRILMQIDTSKTNPSYNQMNNLKVFGLEMVYVPEGPFTLGSPDLASISRASLYKSDENGNPSGLIRITSKGAIQVAAREDSLYYWSEEDLYNGDQKGPVPAGFPKGYEAFYVMKYELSQGQYAAFLNTLPDSWTFQRSPTGGKDYHKKRGGIHFKNGKYAAENPDRPMNFVSFTDGLAFTDWACLRPITELEYEKAARGPGEPLPSEFVWGTSSYEKLERMTNLDGELIFQGDLDESMLSDETKERLGASYYWVMDLSGSLWEKVITIGNPIGRAFKGTHGDGKLDFGHATNEDWPTSDDEIGGFGYRGGAFMQEG
ncbi:MAG: SUMF1/EgtB/PvdO family nonheme iron enzyme [Bacteroidota bacterium]